jgi:drug/metabolite transporter (DMT)-like permease
LAIPTLPRREWLWFAGAITAGGVLAPVLLMAGLARTSAADASLLLNLEAVLTAILAWVVFGENADQRVVTGMGLIVAGSAVLTWTGVHGLGSSAATGMAAVATACICWALDNNLTRRVSAADALFIAGTKGLMAGLANLALAFSIGVKSPAWPLVTEALGIGFFGYGVSLVLFVQALRGLGAARTGAYFSTAPFVGATVAILALHEPATPAFWIAAGLMGLGVWLHLTERHEHDHTHESLTHAHTHRHDEHHPHAHAFAWDGSEPHSHEHQHEPLVHRHSHYPDLHHRHSPSLAE